MAVLAATLVALLPLGYELLRPRAVLAGANGIAPQSLVAAIEPGATLCVPGLEIPPDAGSVEIPLSGRGAARPELTGTLRWAGGPADTVRAPPEPAAGSEPARFALPGRAGIASLCLTAPVALDVAGTSGAADAGPPPTLDGAPVDARITVRYPEAERHSLLSRLPAPLESATRFKPVGPWAGWVVLLGAGLAAPALAVLLVLRAGRWSPRRLAVGIAIVAISQSAGTALLAPAFDGPDEPDHFAYVESIARGAGVPDGDPASSRPAYSDRHGALLLALRHRARAGSPLGKAIYTARDEAAWERSRDVPPGNGGGPTIPTRIHSPLYYGLLTPGYALGSVVGGEPGAHLGARVLSALALIVIALCAFGIVRELAPRRLELAAGAGLLVALQPQLAFMSAVVNNDAGVNAASAVVVWLAVRALRRPPDVRRTALVGGALAVAVLMKATGFSLAAVLALMLLAGIVRFGRAFLGPAIAGLVAFALPLTAWVLLAPAFDRDSAVDEFTRQLAFCVLAIAAVAAVGPVIARSRRAVAAVAVAGGAGALALMLGGDTLSGRLDRLGYTASYIWQVFAPRAPFMDDHWAQGWPRTFVDVYVRETFGGFGQLSHIVPTSRAWIVLAGAVLLLVAAAWTYRRRGRAVRARGWELALLLAAPLAVVIGFEYSYATPGERPVPAEQGRYLFPAAAAVAALAALAVAGLRPVAARAAMAVAVVAMAALALDGRLFYLAGAYL